MRLAPNRKLDGRWFAASLALVLIAGQGASLAHLAVVRHGYCAEHGELVDLGAEAPAGLPTAPTDATDHVDSLPASGAGGHEHEHCAVMGHRRDAILGEHVGTALAPQACGEPVRSAGAPVVSASPIFRLAPKQSPPA